MLLGGRVASVGCQTHRECLCWGTAGQPSRYCHGAVLFPTSIGRILLQKFQIFFCTGSRPSTANVLTVSLPCWVNICLTPHFLMGFL